MAGKNGSSAVSVIKVTGTEAFPNASERPCRYCAANERDELAPPHRFLSYSITLSARANSDSGTVTPNA